ncbi:hypothetical protein PN441_00075 [Spirulina major CS-329]|uniref:hypothetical protein n=1 Tax=Spirulina TaxID=1154 RepID=UPI00233078A2|nr:MULTISPECIES: hypothetical protein [Spirulina]MDB9494119.1 hypothetical protein [Spirulina subsalsa CS-330]MDB9501453.1 hypothetical protein [Spirulina major CS-329]
MGGTDWVGEVWRSHLSLTAQITLPCLPAQSAATLAKVAGLVETFGSPLTVAEREQLGESLHELILTSFQSGPGARLQVEITPNAPPETGITCNFQTTIAPLPPPSQPTDLDPTVLAWVERCDPGAAIAMIGAGAGHGAIALRQWGYAVEAWEWRGDTPDPAVIQQDQDFLNPLARLTPSRFELAIAPDVVETSLRHPDTLRLLLAKLCDGVVSGGYLLLGLWISAVEVEPAVQEWVQWCGGLIVTQGQLMTLTAGLPIMVIEQRAIALSPALDAIPLPASLKPQIQRQWVMWQRS